MTIPPTEAFIRNFSAPYSLLQRHLVGEENIEQEMEEEQHLLAQPIIMELTTPTFLPHVMDVQKVRSSLHTANSRLAVFDAVVPKL